MEYNRWASADPQYPPNPNPQTDPYYPHYQHHPTSAHYSYTAVPPSAHAYSSPPHAPLGPPGTESYTPLSAYYPSGAPYVSQPSAAAVSYYQEPPPAYPQSWTVKDAIRQYGADPVAYAPVTESQNMESVLPLIPVNGITRHFSKRGNRQTKVVQSVWCEVCRLLCNSKDVYDKHIFGRKHKGNLTQLLNKDSNTPAIGHSNLVSGADLETKKQKLMQGGVSVDSVMPCTLCNVVCNSQDAFHKHLAGKKHANQVAARNGMRPPIPQNPANKVVRPPSKNGTKQGQQKIKIVQSAWCEVCKIDCTSKDILDQHKLGKKHKKKLEQLQAPKPEANSTKPLIGPEEKPTAAKGKKKMAPERAEDLETKRQKVMEGGAAADAVKICEVCNVICNSEKVYNFHVAGQKHIFLVQQRNSVGTTVPDPSAVSAV